MAIRYSGQLRVRIFAQDLGGIGPRYYYRGTVSGPNGERWRFAKLSPSPMETPGPEGLAIDSSDAYDRAAIEALAWAWMSESEGGGDWVFNAGEFHPDHSTEDKFIVSRRVPR